MPYVDAELLEPPPPSAAEPQPAFEEGQNLPFVPPIVARLDLGAHGDLSRRWGAYPPRLRAGTGLSFLSARPLPYGAFADPVGLWDVSLGAGWGPWSLSLEIYNLLDSRYAAIEYNFASAWQPEETGSRLPARHIAAGAPRSVMVTLEVQL